MNEKVALLFFDLHDLRLLNEILGYDAGNNVIQNFSDKLTLDLTENDMAGRVNGNQFVVILNNVEGLETVETKVIELLESLNKPYNYTGKTFMVRSKVGIALFPEHGNSHNTIKNQAELAMNSLKEKDPKGYAFAQVLKK